MYKSGEGAIVFKRGSHFLLHLFPFVPMGSLEQFIEISNRDSYWDNILRFDGAEGAEAAAWRVATIF
jgi:hypothetical protein